MCLCLSCAGVWSSPPTTGTRPPPCAGFSLTKVVHNRAILFGGRSSTGRYNDVYIIDLQAMVSVHVGTAVSPEAGHPVNFLYLYLHGAGNSGTR